MKQRVVDTDTLSYIIKQKEPIASKARDYILEHGGLSTTVVSVYEILRGLTYTGATRQLQVVERFIATNRIFDLDLSACRRAADIHARLRSAGALLEDADLLIAAIALANDCVLVTNNTAHYARVPGLELENWADDEGPPSG